MNRARIALGIAAAGAMGWHATLVAAQEQSHSQEFQIDAGEIFGDRLTETPISGSTPRLNDTYTVGGKYNYNFNGNFGAQFQFGYSPRVTTGHVESGNTDGVVVLCDLDAVWNIVPDLRINGSRVVPYALAGAGYAWLLNLHKTIQGTTADGTQVSITEGNGYTADAGLGVKYFVTDTVFVDLNGRYRYFSRLVHNDGQGLNTAESTLGFGWRF
jgi:opacity protein-like surface antigen